MNSFEITSTFDSHLKEIIDNSLNNSNINKKKTLENLILRLKSEDLIYFRSTQEKLNIINEEAKRYLLKEMEKRVNNG